jgi:hypothetical protein
MIEMLIAGALESLSPEMKKNLKKLDEFFPLIAQFHDAIPIDKEKGELAVSYLLRFEKTGIVLYQVVLASKPDVNNGKVFVSRQLNKWDISEKVKEITKDL